MSECYDRIRLEEPGVGEEIHELAREIFPFRRSLTGDGVRQTLARRPRS